MESSFTNISLFRKGGIRLRLRENPFEILAMLVDRPGEFHCRVAYIHENGLDQEAVAPGANPTTIRLDFDFPDTAR